MIKYKIRGFKQRDKKKQPLDYKIAKVIEIPTMRKCIYVFGNHKSLLMTPSRERWICGSGWSVFFSGSSLARPFFATLLYELYSMVLHRKVFNWIKIMAAKICHFIIIFARWYSCNFSRLGKNFATYFCFFKLFTAFIHFVFLREKIANKNWNEEKKNSCNFDKENKWLGKRELFN